MIRGYLHIGLSHSENCQWRAKNNQILINWKQATFRCVSPQPLRLRSVIRPSVTLDDSPSMLRANPPDSQLSQPEPEPEPELAEPEPKLADGKAEPPSVTRCQWDSRVWRHVANFSRSNVSSVCQTVTDEFICDPPVGPEKPLVIDWLCQRTQWRHWVPFWSMCGLSWIEYNIPPHREIPEYLFHVNVEHLKALRGLCKHYLEV